MPRSLLSHTLCVTAAFVRSTTDRSKLEGVPVDYVVGDAMYENFVP